MTAVTRILLLALLSACTAPPPSCHVREYRSEGGQLTFEISSSCEGSAWIDWGIRWDVGTDHARIEIDCGVPWYLGYDLESASFSAQIMQPGHRPVECSR